MIVFCTIISIVFFIVSSILIKESYDVIEEKIAGIVRIISAIVLVWCVFSIISYIKYNEKITLTYIVIIEKNEHNHDTAYLKLTKKGKIVDGVKKINANDLLQCNFTNGEIVKATKRKSDWVLGMNFDIVNIPKYEF